MYRKGYCLPFFLFGFLLASVQTSQGQNANLQNLTNIVPPTPEAAAFAKYVDQPVGYSTGTAQVSIPLYTVTNDALSVPISLSYNTSGIKVEEAATWVGLGWNLSAGGSITRIVRGLPDDYDTSGYMYTATTVQYLKSIPYNSTEFANEVNIRAYHSQTLDLEPDIFIYSVMGHSGKFYYNQQSHQFVQTPGAAVKIAYSLNGTNIKGWTLTFPDGVVAYLGLSQDGSRTGYDTHNNSSSFSISNGAAVDPPGGAATPAHITGWQVMDIVEPAGHALRFSYTPYTVADYGRGGETQDYKLAGALCTVFTDNSRISASFYKDYSTKAYISQISSELGDIFFIPSTADRQDVLADPAATKSLASIVVKNKASQVIKSFTFDYGYFVSTDVTAITGMNEVTDVSSKRLYLKSVTESSALGDVQLPYRFYYDTAIILPNRMSANQDYWGYYNGKINGQFLTPKISMFSVLGYGSGYLTGADRSVDFNYTKACSLKKIVYPTGGSTEYYFEGNDVNTGYNTRMNGYPLPGETDKSFGLYKEPAYLSPTDPTTYQDTLVIGDIIGSASISTTITGCTTGGAQTDDCHAQFHILGITDNTYNQSFQANNFTTSLPKGKYLVQATVTDDPDNPVDFTLYLTWQEAPSLVNYVAGGMRIAKIVSSDGVGGTLVKRLGYRLFSDTSKSSGELINMPIYKSSIYCSGDDLEADGAPIMVRIFSNSIVPLSSLDGQAIHYSNVTEYYSDGPSYKTEYAFSDDLYGVIDPAGANYPTPTDVQRDWRRDLLLDKKVYEQLADPDSYRLLKWESHNFSFFESLEESVPFGIKTAPYVNSFYFGYSYYNFTTEWYLEDSVVSSEYSYLADGSAGPVLSSYSKSFFTPGNYYLPADVRTIDSRGQVAEKKTWYPFDYTDGASASISTLKQGFFGLPVKQQTTKNSKLVDGQVIAYNTLGLPVTVYKYENAALIDTVTHNSSGLVPANYQLKQSIGYSGTYNRMNEVNSWNSAPVAYLWNYNGSYPVAKVMGADSASIAYTSFEGDAAGNWTISSGSLNTSAGLTGHNSFSLTGNISKSGLSSSTTYIVSYWTQGTALSVGGTLTGYPQKGKTVSIGNTTWTLYVHKVSGQSIITVSGSGTIDELRLYPANAQMSSYTYDPLVGMTSQTDMANRVSYYEYDGLSRLKRIRDQDFNILKTFEYQYQAAGGCGGNCYILPMQTAAGTNTIGYPVGVFNVHGKLLGNAANADVYVSKWNSDTADSRIGTLAKGGDSLHFQLALNSGQTAPAGVTGCRYYQVDLHWDQIDGLMTNSGAYVDFGDGTGMNIPKVDSAEVVWAPNTWFPNGYVVHNYTAGDTSLKTITMYHNDGDERVILDDGLIPATSLAKVDHLRGYFPQNTSFAKFSSLQHPSALTVDSVYNWYSLASLQILQITAGDGGHTPCENLAFTQDFGKNLKGLKQWVSSGGGYRLCGIRDTTFKLSRLKSDWNTYFTNLEVLQINDDHWNREDLSKLTHLNYFILVATTDDRANDYSNSPLTIPSSVLDSVLNQIAAGAGQTVQNGFIDLVTGGNNRTGASDAAVALLQSKGWQIIIHW